MKQWIIGVNSLTRHLSQLWWSLSFLPLTRSGLKVRCRPTGFQHHSTPLHYNISSTETTQRIFFTGRMKRLYLKCENSVWSGIQVKFGGILHVCMATVLISIALAYEPVVVRASGHREGAKSRLPQFTFPSSPPGLTHSSTISKREFEQLVGQLWKTIEATKSAEGNWWLGCKWSEHIFSDKQEKDIFSIRTITKMRVGFRQPYPFLWSVCNVFLNVEVHRLIVEEQQHSSKKKHDDKSMMKSM